VFFPLLSPHAVHLGPPPKGTTTRLKATARAPPGGCFARWCCVTSLSVRLCVLVQVLPFAIARDNRVSRVCSSEQDQATLCDTNTPAFALRSLFFRRHSPGGWWAFVAWQGIPRYHFVATSGHVYLEHHFIRTTTCFAAPPPLPPAGDTGRRPWQAPLCAPLWSPRHAASMFCVSQASVL
jgi:hypothetical protein